jgi:hypothetical protein
VAWLQFDDLLDSVWARAPNYQKTRPEQNAGVVITDNTGVFLAFAIFKSV